MKISEQLINRNIMNAEFNECDKIARKENKHEIERGKALEKENYEALHKELKESDFEVEVLETANDVQDFLEVRNAII